MSFMFNPNPFNDKSALLVPALSEEVVSSVTTGAKAIAETLARAIAENNASVIAFDGYASSDFMPIIRTLEGLFAQTGTAFETVAVSDYYKSADELQKLFAENLPQDRETDPVLLFGKRFEGGFAALFDEKKFCALVETLCSAKKTILLYGFGCTHSEELRRPCDLIVYLDLAPKEAVLRAKSGRMTNIGDKCTRPFKEMMRRAYYVDFDLSLTLRKTLLEQDFIDFYIDGTDLVEYKMLPKASFAALASAVVTSPFRTKPVYIEGVWGGQYIKSLRKLPETVKNVAWSFDFIPMEVSVLTQIGDVIMEFPFYTILAQEGRRILGEKSLAKFGGFFPIRFNYDDTFHSSGNMSVQVHSDGAYNREHYNELGRQDESYYIAAAGHDAVTYLGFRDDADPDEFIAETKKSEREHTEIDYQKYIHAEPSKPGLQVMIPAGTVHASGRNQVVLEIGSLTMGSYTYKVYDYLRLDLDGIPRPIHTRHGERVLKKERNETWVKNNIVQTPKQVRCGEGYREVLLGEHDLLYFSLRQLEFETEITDDTAGVFHVLSLVDGERVVIESLEDPTRRYLQNYLDIVIVPACVGKYRIRNLGNAPVKVHKTLLAEGFEHDNR